MYTLKSPFVKFSQTFDGVDDAYQFAKDVLKKDNDIKFITITMQNEVITSLIKPGYKKYDFKAFKLFDSNNLIKDYFLLKIDGKKFFYIKTK